MANELIGHWGERLAAEYLQKKRYRIVGANYRGRMGEIDRIAEKGKYLVFVEVKMRRSSAFAEAREFVDRHKQERILTAASLYLSQNETEKQPRFDVIEIYAPDGMATPKPRITHLEDAFS